MPVRLNIKNCTQLTLLDCRGNSLSKLDTEGCENIRSVYCNNNKITEAYITTTHLCDLHIYDNCLTSIDLAGYEFVVGHMISLSPQNASHTLYKNKTDDYTCSLLLNNPTFGNSAISYSEGTLKSTDSTVTQTSFTVQTNSIFELTGTIKFTYSVGTGIDILESSQLNIYSNPHNNTLVIECEDSYDFELYDMLGKKTLTGNGSGKMDININHLPKGIYIVSVFSKNKLIGNSKIVKQ